MMNMLQISERVLPLPPDLINPPAATAEETLSEASQKRRDEFFSIYRWSETHAMKSLIRFIMGEVDINKLKTHKLDLESHLNVLLSNLLYAHFRNASLAICLQKNHYAAPSREYYRYNKAKIGYTGIRSAISILEQVLALEKTLGQWTSGEDNPFTGVANDNSSTRTTIRLPDEIAKCLVDLYFFTPSSISTHPFRELIEVRHSKKERDEDGNPYVELKRYIPYSETRATASMRKMLQSYNRILSNTVIEIASEGAPSKRIPSGIVKRVFAGDFQHLGRFYGGEWQHTPSDLRKGILLDGKPTVELDFKALHAHLVYHRDGLELNAIEDDPYTLRGILNLGEVKALRNLVKDAFLIGLNCKSYQQWRCRLEHDIKDPKRNHRYPSYAQEINLRDLLKGIKDKHHPIKRHFHQGEGLHLQYIDSCIAEYVIRNFCKLEKPILCYHDGFRVIDDDRDLLEGLMSDAYKKVVHSQFSPPIDTK